jgi:glycosyltransferase involved in cell wall biosynthesis
VDLKPVVLQLIDSFHQGGSERQAIQLTRHLVESGRFDLRFASLNPAGILRDQVEVLDLGDIPSFPLTSLYDKNAIVQLRRLMNFLRRTHIDILHTHDFYTNVFGMTAGCLARVPVRIASMRETAGMRTAAQQSAQRIAYGLAHKVVANSQAVRKHLVDQGLKAAKIEVVYNGLDTARLIQHESRIECLERLGLSSDSKGASRKFVTIVANMRLEIKDYPMFLRAAQLVKRAVTDAEFLLAGEGELSEQLRALARELGIEVSTHFLGRCDNVGALLQVSDVCALSSKAEGFSNAILEYMAASRPVVATDVGGAREAIIDGETGYLVESGDYVTMAERIILLLRRPEQARLFGERGRRVVDEKFSCEAQLERTEQMYESMIHERK